MTPNALIAQLREKAAKADLPDHDNCCEVGECPACDAQDDIEALLANPAYLTAILDAFDEMREALERINYGTDDVLDGALASEALRRLDAEIGGEE